MTSTYELVTVEPSTTARRAHALAANRARVLDLNESDVLPELQVLAGDDAEALAVGLRTFRLRRASILRKRA